MCLRLDVLRSAASALPVDRTVDAGAVSGSEEAMSKAKTDKPTSIPEVHRAFEITVDGWMKNGAVSPLAGECLKFKFRESCYELLRIVAKESERWTNRCDDAKRIPDVIYEKADYFKASDE